LQQSSRIGALYLKAQRASGIPFATLNPILAHRWLAQPSRLSCSLIAIGLELSRPNECGLQCRYDVCRVPKSGELPIAVTLERNRGLKQI
jgi:hypothetical protein